jgi:cytochrome P450
MPSVTLILATLVVAYTTTFAYSFVRNRINGSKTGFPLIHVPIDANWLPWMILGVPLKNWFERQLPRSLYKRIVLTIYGWEFKEKYKPYDELAGPRGDRKSFVLVTAGRLEFWTWDSQIVTQVLSRPRDFQQFDIGNIILNKFGDNILTTDGDIWARHRKVVAGVINERISKEVFRESIIQTQGLLNEAHAASDSKGAIETNKLFDWAKKITIRVLSGAGMGAHIPWQGNNDQQPAPGYKQTYTQSVTHVISNLSGPILLPQWLLMNYPSW